ncbi:MAG: REP-associated tyrosine transposase [Bacteroidota bacterium]
MSTGYQIQDQNAPYFFTFQVVYWIDIFTRKECRDIVIDSLRYCQKEKDLEIYAWVIMSNHIHIIMKSLTGELSNTVRDFKKYTSKKLVNFIKDNPEESRREWMIRLFKHAAKRQNKDGNYQVWTHKNHAIEMISNDFFETKVHYIHNNPVRAGLVKNQEDYIYSSASNYADDDGLLEIVPVTFRLK